MLKRTMIVAALCAASCGGDPDSGELPEGVDPFDGTDVALASGDLAPLWPMLGGARLIGLGESIHTSGGFYAAKHRLIRVLIEEHGVRVFAMETPRGRARKIDDYLLSGDCDRPAEAIFDRAIFEVFVDDNTVALVRWICERNAARPEDRVRFFGFDVQQPDEDGAEIHTFLETWAGADAPALLAGISTCPLLYLNPPPTEDEHTACVSGLVALAMWTSDHQDSLTAAAGARALRSFEIAAISFRAAQDHYFLQNRPGGAPDYEARDRGMASVFQGVLALDFPPDARVAVWAHNVHLAMNHDRVTSSVYEAGATTFGTVLAKIFGAEYAAVALTGYAPGANWPQVDLVVEHTVFGTSDGALEQRLHAYGRPFLLVDPRAEFLDPSRPQVLNQELMVPSEQFAAIIYLDHSPPMDALFW